MVVGLEGDGLDEGSGVEPPTEPPPTKLPGSTLGGLCRDVLYDPSVTWNTDAPDISVCVQKTLLVWLPCGFLILLTVPYMWRLYNSKARNIPHNALNIIRTVMVGGLALLAVADIVFWGKSEVSSIADILDPAVRLATWLLVIVIMQMERARGCQSSALLWIFWLLYILASVPRLYSQIRRETSAELAQTKMDNVEVTSNTITLATVVILWVLSFFLDAKPQYRESVATDASTNPCPEPTATFPSVLVFGWFNSLCWTGYKRSIVHDDLWDLNPRDASATVVPKFNSNWLPRLQAANLTKKVSDQEASFNAEDETVVVEPGKKGKSAKETLSIFPPLVKTFGMSFFVGSILKLIHDVMIFAAPLILRRLIAFASKFPDVEQEPMWKGVFYALLLLLTTGIQTIILSQYFYRMYLVGIWVKASLISAVYRKSLVVTASAKKDTSSGEVVNLMSVDCQRISDMTPYINMLWSAPLQICIAVYMLYQLLGPSVLAGLAIMVVLIPVNGAIAVLIRRFQVKQMKEKDIRVKKMNEILQGIKILKLYAWEPSFKSEVEGIRNGELDIMVRMCYLSAGTSFIWTCAPFVVALVTFATYVLSSDENVLTSEKAFTALALFNILRFPLSMLPMMITSAVQANVSIQRINKFMRSAELDPEAVDRSKGEGPAVEVSGASFRWDVVEKEKIDEKPEVNGDVSKEEKKAEVLVNGNETVVTTVIDNDDTDKTKGEAVEPFTLRDINLKVPKNSLCAVVGTVGSGKSSLLSALLGEMDMLKGDLKVNGAVAYVSQQAWIQNATLKENILFGAKEDTEKYNKAVDDCALTADLEMLPAGDNTEIGEKGINLSGGQKQRVSVARAVYAKADVYFLDDPLSAVDSHVGKHIFDRVIGPEGCLKNSTRILVTHNVTHLHMMDQIVVFKDGRISEVGTYKELLGQKGDFALFLVQYLSEKEDGVSELDENIKKELQQELGQDSSSISDNQDIGELVRQMSEARGERKNSSSSPRESPVKTLSPVLPSSPVAAGSPTRLDSVKEEVKTDLSKSKQYQDEKAETGKVSWRVYIIYLKNMGYMMFLSCIFLYLMYQLFTAFSSVWLSNWSDNKLPFESSHVEWQNMTKEDQTSRRDLYLAIYGALGGAQAISAVVGSLLLYLSTITGAKNLHHKMLDNILRAPMAFFDTTPQGRIINRFGKDVDVLDSTMPMILRGWITCLLSVGVTFLVIMFATPVAIVPIVVMLCGYYLVQKVYVATSRQLKRLESVSRSPIYSNFGETVAGASVIRAYGLAERFVKESERRVDYNHQATFTAAVSNRWLAIRLEIVGNLIIFAAAILAVMGRDSLTPGLVGLSISYALQVTQTLNWLVRMSSEVETNIVAVERLNEYSEVEREADWDNEETAPPADWPQNGRIELNSYSIRYRPGLDLVLKEVNADIKGGERIGIVGRTGAGKSSLTLGLFRMVEPATGSIHIDGVDISKLGLHNLRSRLTIIPQDPVLFSGTIRRNLDPFEEHHDDRLWEALKQSHLHGFVSGLKESLQHEVVEGGENLSVGQRQLICLARALLRKTKVLVLDEATAAVDLETDDLIQRTIRTEFEGSTVITIAHRLNTILDYDRILVLKEGKVVEFDTPSVLIEKEGSLFKSMCQDAGIDRITGP